MQDVMPELKRSTFHFVLIFLLISFNLRMAFSAANPMLDTLIVDLHLSPSDSGLFALLPVMAMGVAAPLGARLSCLIRPRLLIVHALAAAILGVIWRSYGGIPGLYGGTVITGLGLGITGSVILGIVKVQYPQYLPELMGGYTACVCLGTSVGSGSATPIALMLGSWQKGLLFWALPLLIALILWVEYLVNSRDKLVNPHPINASMLPLLRQRRAWDVTLFYLFRVAGSWLIIVWLSTLMRLRGLGAIEAGLVLSLATVFQIPSSLLSHQFAVWLGSRRRLMLVTIPLSCVACAGLLEAPLDLWPLFSILLGLCIGSIFTLGMNFIVEGAADEAGTVALSGMAQGIGFIVGGALAWLVSSSMLLPHPELFILGFYTLFALSGLAFGLRCDRATPQKT